MLRMIDQAKQDQTRSRLIAQSVNLDWALASVHADSDSITIEAEPLQYPGGGSRGYSYTAHIKRDPQANWESEIALPARAWEAAQRGTALWEVARGDDYNYADAPWQNRPPIARLVSALEKTGHQDIAARIAEAFKERR